ncbi:hypothetical protein NP493_732g02017 [Ridgeia piscesae]|uniref:Uncharacterized protein n=1 Tax=Ridgeia piscesae TaxID=27915 RepID=A0AAD9KQG3_RIDPI|nr:hypothetical protein NP493_732g02017 [Ridgeia piscesae]
MSLSLCHQVIFSEHLNSVLSISRMSGTAMFIGDLEQKLTNSYFHVSRGLNTLDYSNKLNLIVTGGQDALVRVWNPYVTKKPISILRGHQSPVTQVHLNDCREQVISLAENRDIRVHDINSHVCVQTFFRKAIPDFGFRSFGASIFNEYRQSLLFATARLMLLEHRDEDLRNLQVISHTKPVTAAIYNPLFKQVVSAAADSTVTVWTMASGHKAMQFRVQTMTRMSEPDYIEVSVLGGRERGTDKPRRQVVISDAHTSVDQT